ncbi:MAG: hypothetical protein HQL51_07675 [Magnetococcales bacterium]|nr:hypothetical protein [Magnetococcales bacterium]
MKVAINYKAQEGPWGGGNFFVLSLTRRLQEAGHQVVNHLGDPDLDFILLIDPRVRSPNVTFGMGAILRHRLRHPHALVIHRINECDERKNTHHMNSMLARANYGADHTVFVGSWLLELPVWRSRPNPERSVILNGSDPTLYHPRGYRPWNGREPLRLVTHHWGGHWMKGFDVYQRLDQMMGEAAWRDRIQFTYIGNLPAGFRFINARHEPPCAGAALAERLRAHHVYVTGSRNEPGGNHQNEGALCGLPLIYRMSGCLPEYCAGFGLGFDPPEFEAVLSRMMAEYAEWVPRMAGYPHDADRTAREWLALLERLDGRREALAVRRGERRNPWLFWRNQLAWFP